MTDNEIIKALECCYTTGTDCEDCPMCDFDECNDILMAKYVRDLINRQKAEIDKCINIIFKKEDTTQLIATERQRYYDELQTAQAEIERLQSILLRFMDEVAKWEEKHGLDVSELPLIPICDEGRDIIDHYRAQAIKQFAERLKEKKNTVCAGHGLTTYAVAEYDIDCTLKEMVGEV